MYHIQIAIPFIFVLGTFIAIHLFVEGEGSGVYIPKSDNFSVPEKIEEEAAGVISILPDKYNYLKIENVFSGKFRDKDQLFSVEFSILTKQQSVASDLFIEKMREIEPEIIAEITKVIVDVVYTELSTPDGREELCSTIRDQINGYLEGEGIPPEITEVFVINFNII
jgi:flagellar basal body-associated protein FliL